MKIINSFLDSNKRDVKNNYCPKIYIYSTNSTDSNQISKFPQNK